MYRIENGKLMVIGGSIKPNIVEINKPAELQPSEIPKPKPKTDKEIIEEIKKVRIDKAPLLSEQAMEKRLKKFVEFKI